MKKVNRSSCEPLGDAKLVLIYGTFSRYKFSDALLRLNKITKRIKRQTSYALIPEKNFTAFINTITSVVRAIHAEVNRTAARVG